MRKPIGWPPSTKGGGLAQWAVLGSDEAEDAGRHQGDIRIRSGLLRGLQMGRPRPKRGLGVVQEVRAQRDEHPAEVEAPDRVGRSWGGQVPLLHEIPHGSRGAVRRHGDRTPGDGVHDVARGILQQLPPRSAVPAREVRRGTESHRQELPGGGRGRKSVRPGKPTRLHLTEVNRASRHLREFHPCGLANRGRMADRSESATCQNPTNCNCGSSPAGRRFPSDSHVFGEDPRLAVVVGLLGMPPERVLRDLGEDPFLRIAVSRLALQDDFVPDLSPDERLDEFLHRGDPGGLPSVQLRIVEPNRRPDRDGSARLRITGHEDVLHRPSVQDPSKMDLTLRPELESVGPWIASFFDDPVSDELTKECELLLEVGEWPLGTEPVDRPQRMGSAQPWLLLGHDLGIALDALSPEPSGDGAAGRLITGSGPEGSISSTIAPSLPVRRSSRPRAFVPPHLRRRRRTVVEIRQGHARDRFPEGSLDAAKVSFVLRSHERDGLPGGLHAGRPSDPVHVVGRDGRNVVVDHVGDALDVDPARRDVRRDEDLVPSTSESGESRLPLALTAVPVDSCDVETGLADLPGHAVRAPLRADEDEDRHHVFPAEQADEQGCLQVLGNRVDFVADRRRRPVGRGHGDSDGVAPDRPGERLDLRRHRRGGEEGLSLPRGGLHDPADVREGPHVEHPVRLVEDQDPYAAELERATGHVVQEPAGCRDDDIDARSEGVLLRRHADAPVDCVAADAGPFREATEGHLDLGGQFAGRREDEGARATRGLLHKSLEDRKEKRGRLPRSRLRGADHIAARQNRGDRLLLDRRGGLVAEAVDGSKQDRVEAEEIEGVLRVRCLHRGSYGFIGLRITTVDENAASLILPHDRPDASADRGIDAMKRATSRRGRTGPEYRVRVSFGVPLDFAFAWCTDYTPEDASLEGETYQRKIIERTSRRVIFEDLEESDDGWNWSRDVVTLRPPNRWHMVGIGNRRDVRADYVLSPLPDGRTRFDLRWSRRPKVPDAKKLTKAEREASTMRAWKRFAAAMEQDYRRSRRRPTR